MNALINEQKDRIFSRTLQIYQPKQRWVEIYQDTDSTKLHIEGASRS